MDLELYNVTLNFLLCFKKPIRGFRVMYALSKIYSNQHITFLENATGYTTHHTKKSNFV